MVYYTLQQLEPLGLIRIARAQRSRQGGPARSIWRTTPAGRAAAEAWLSMPAEHIRDVRSELMVKLALNDRAGTDSRPLVRAQLAQFAPLAAALDERLRAADGFEHTLVLWRREAMTATMQFLTALEAVEGRTLPRANRRGPRLRALDHGSRGSTP